MSDLIISEQRAWGAADSISFFASHRSRIVDLYPSERVFLPRAASDAGAVLDVGCACGGFAPIMRTLNPNLHYTGVDIVPSMIAVARRHHPEARFLAAAGHALPFADQSFDLVHCSGVVHLNSDYPAMVCEMWRVARGKLLFDMRLTDGVTRTGTFSVDFGGAPATARRVLPYNLVNIAEMQTMIDDLPSPPVRAEVFGYPHPPSANASFGPEETVLMAFLLLSRHGEPGWHIDLVARPPSEGAGDDASA